MNRGDFLRLIGGDEKQTEYLPVAFLLRCGYGCAGYFNLALNSELQDTCIVLNARLMPLDDERASNSVSIHGFSDFLQEIVYRLYDSEQQQEIDADQIYGKSVPLCAIPLSEIAAFYPVAHIGKLMQLSRGEIAGKADEKSATAKSVPAFLDFNNRSVILKLLRTKLW